MTMRGTNQEEDWLEERWERLTQLQEQGLVARAVKPLEWIFVLDCLPVPGVQVLIAHRSAARWLIAYRSPKDPRVWIDNADMEEITWGEITHWMPLHSPNDDVLSVQVELPKQGGTN